MSGWESGSDGQMGHPRMMGEWEERHCAITEMNGGPGADFWA